MPKPVAMLLSATLWLTSTSFFACAGSLYLVLSLVFSPRALHPLVKPICRVILMTAGQRLRVEGSVSVDNGPYIYMYNHASMLDTLVLIASLPEFIGAVGKREQFQIPIWGRILRRWGVVPIDRSQRTAAIESMNRIEAELRKGLSLLISPEGTRSHDGLLGPFKKGAFHIALHTGAPILPVIIDGAFRGKNRNSWMLRPGTITVQLGAPMPRQSPGPDAMARLQQQTRVQLSRRPRSAHTTGAKPE